MKSDLIVPVVITALLLVLVLLGMWLGWRARARRDAGASGYALPERTAAPTVTADTFYVASTVHERPLERRALKGLGFRARASVAVGPDGIRLVIPGTDDVWIPTAMIRGAGTATYTIDRVVEPGGLLCLTWLPSGSDTLADSYLRFSDPTERSTVMAAVRVIAPQTPPDQNPAPTESES